MIIPYGKQFITEDDIIEVANALRSPFLTQGPLVDQYESHVSKYLGCSFSLAVNSATSALHLGLISLGISSNDIVWTTPISFVATANCVRYVGGLLDFVDVDPLTGLLCSKALKLKLENTPKSLLPKLVICVNYGGSSPNMKAIHALSLEYDFKILEDASHAFGATYADMKVGSCVYSQAVIFSTHPVKIFTTGEGGLLCTNSLEVYNMAKLCRSHGISKTLSEKELTESPWMYHQICLGYNYRLTDLQAALGLSQLKKVTDFVSERRQIHSKYLEAFSLSSTIRIVGDSQDSQSSFHLVTLQVTSEDKQERDSLFRYLRRAGIFVQIHYIPIYHQPYYRGSGFRNFSLKNTELFYATSLSLPIYIGLSDADIDFIVRTVKKHDK